MDSFYFLYPINTPFEGSSSELSFFLDFLGEHVILDKAKKYNGQFETFLT